MQHQPQPPLDPTKLPTASSIRLKVHEIREMKKAGKTLDEVRKAHLDFARQYPKLVETVMQDDLDTTQLNYMLKMFDRVQQQRVSYETASQKVGKAMFDQYLAPNLTPEQMATVQSKMQELKHVDPAELSRRAVEMSGLGGGGGGGGGKGGGGRV